MVDFTKDIKDDIWEGEMRFQRLRAGLASCVNPVPFGSVHLIPEQRKKYISEVRKYLKQLESCHQELQHDEAALKKLLR